MISFSQCVDRALMLINPKTLGKRDRPDNAVERPSTRLPDDLEDKNVWMPWEEAGASKELVYGSITFGEHLPPVEDRPSLGLRPDMPSVRTQVKSVTAPGVLPLIQGERGDEGTPSPTDHWRLRGRIVRAVRADGATVRDSPDIDASEAIGRLLQNELFAVKTTCLLLAPDEECVPVVRLGGLPISSAQLSAGITTPWKTMGDGQKPLQWISLTGRTKFDHGPIAEVFA
ncbi:unnamed protein product [Symbiodinium microadriaticum]|nr:unnamed protein product [Symbiodinium microadriaticum]